MKVFMLHVGDPAKNTAGPEGLYLKMICFNDGKLKRYFKKDIINSVSQMLSIKRANVDVKYGFFTGRKSLKELIKAGLRLRKEIKHESIELVHALWGGTTSLMGVVFSPVPVVISFCGSDLLYDTIISRNYISHFFSQISGVFAKQIIVKSKQMYDLLWPRNRTKCTIIPNGVDMNIFYPIEKTEARRKLSWDIDKKIILFFPGGGTNIKDPALAEATISYVQKIIPETIMVKVENVIHEDLNYYYNAVDALLLTSVHEGSNNSIKEALCCNLPIVAVNCGDAKERLQGVSQCYVINNRSYERLGECLIKILKDKSRSNGRNYIQNLSLEKVAHKVIDVYKAALV